LAGRVLQRFSRVPGARVLAQLDPGDVLLVDRLTVAADAEAKAQILRTLELRLERPTLREIEHLAAHSADSAQIRWRVETGGRRGERRLTPKELGEARAFAQELGMPPDRIHYSDHVYTAYGTVLDQLYIGTDVLPKSLQPGEYASANSRLSMRGALAHEVVGHRQAALAGETRQAVYVEEAQASLRAAHFAPGLNEGERALLTEDAVDRLSPRGLTLEDVELWLDRYVPKP
jgi:hypothetical protein